MAVRPPEASPPQQPAEKPVFAPARSAVPDHAVPGPQAEHQDRNPFWRNKTPNAVKNLDYPESPEAPLRREQNYSREEEVIHTAEAISSREFEAEFLTKRQREVYYDGFWGRAQSYLSGDGHWEIKRDENKKIVDIDLQGSDFRINKRTGSVEYRRGHAALRETINFAEKIVLKGAITAGVAMAMNWLLGAEVGSAAVADMVGRTVLGSAIGRGSVELTRHFSSQERHLKQQEIAATLRYFKKLNKLNEREIAYQKFDETDPTDPFTDEPITRETWELRHNQAVIDRVNFQNSFEHLSVDIQYQQGEEENDDGTPNKKTKGFLGKLFGKEADIDPYIDLEHSDNNPEKRDGTEMYQPSYVSPDSTTMAELRNKLESERHNWENRSEWGDMIGSMAVTAVTLLNGGWGHLTGKAYDNMTNAYNSGETVKGIDIDRDGVSHPVKQIQDQAYYLYKSVGERLAAERIGDVGAAALDGFKGIAEHGGHLLYEGAIALGQLGKEAFYREAVKRVGIQLAGVMAATVGRFFIGKFFNDGRHQRDADTRTEFIHNQEMKRRRLLPEGDVRDQLLEMARNNRLPLPGQYYLQDLSENGDNSANQIMKVIRTDEIDLDHPERSCVDMQVVNEAKEFNPVQRVPLIDLVRADSRFIMVIRNEKFAKKKEEERRGTASTGAGAAPSGRGPSSFGSGESGSEGPTPVQEPAENVPEGMQKTEGGKLLEKQSGRVGNYETAGQHEANPDQKEKALRETFTFGRLPNGQQLVVSISSPDKSEKKIADLKKAAAELGSAYAGIADDLEQSDAAADKNTKKLSDLCARVAGADISLTLIVTTQEGKFFAYRHNDDKALVLQIPKVGEVEEIFSKQKKNTDYFFGDQIMSDGDRIALLDPYLAALQDKDKKKISATLLKEDSRSLPEIIDALIKAGKSKNAKFNDFYAIVTEFKKEKEPQAAPKISVPRLTPEGNIEAASELEVKPEQVFIRELTDGTMEFLKVDNISDGKITTTPFGLDQKGKIIFTSAPLKPISVGEFQKNLTAQKYSFLTGNFEKWKKDMEARHGHA
ncbi:MAG: hypothetical protein WC107_02760 [Patescibacteria group bacterium]